MFKKIMVLHDLSDASKRALDWAVNLGAYFGSHLKIYHVTRSQVKNRDVKSLIRKQLRSYEFIREFLDGKTLRGLGRVEIKVRVGRIIPSLLQMIQKEDPDLVVAGTHSRKGLKHIFLGSVAENIVRYSPVPVLIAKRPPNLPPKKIRGILIPTDFSKFTEEALLLGVQLCRQVECNLTLAHVIAPPPVPLLKAIGPLGQRTGGGVGSSDNEKRSEKAAEGRLRSIIARHRSLKIKPYISKGLVVDEISKAAKRTDSDIILIPTHGREGLSHLFMGSVAEMVVRYTDCNVLSFCPEKQTARRREYLRKMG